MICSVCLFAWCKYSHYDWFQIPTVCYWTQRWEEVNVVGSHNRCMLIVAQHWNLRQWLLCFSSWLFFILIIFIMFHKLFINLNIPIFGFVVVLITFKNRNFFIQRWNNLLYYLSFLWFNILFIYNLFFLKSTLMLWHKDLNGLFSE